jgi:hypothetical protein
MCRGKGYGKGYGPKSVTYYPSGGARTLLQRNTFHEWVAGCPVPGHTYRMSRDILIA